MRKALFRYRNELVRIELKCPGIPDGGATGANGRAGAGGWTWDLYINGELKSCGQDAPFAFAEEAMAAAKQASRHLIDLLHASS
ncbi:hypothetical protein I5R65_01570 [Herbaspirillum sp. AP02]|uniref:hypothetical protein n=1 Tax=unclassified Herbaspirillum TaxID=2624150 RepID=UPI0018CA3E98|nr:hypothetical protein [Herbaspirillum sp. AP02]MBG7618142.1 hypothetical protein [Herbaspirillum sp. AP02]